MNSRQFAAAAVVKEQLSKDYYKILQISNTATPEQIKDAYRTLAKRHHPDVRSGETDAQMDPDVEKFRDIVEAYQVLSVSESRASFDIERKRNPHLYNPIVNEELNMMNQRDKRDKRGLSPRQKASRGSYAEMRLAELKAEREKYNVNDIGYYNGGVPRRNRGAVRGDADGLPGYFHTPQLHNFKHYNHPDSFRVTSEDKTKFNHWMATDEADFNRTMPGHPMYYDRDFNYVKDRDYWLKAILGLFAGSYLYKKFRLEQDRARMTARLEGYKGMAAHHFANRGGVVVLKQFIGFEKYHQNNDQLMTWYRDSYPNAFKGSQ